MSESEEVEEAKTYTVNSETPYNIYDYGVKSYVGLPRWKIELFAFLHAPYEGSLSKFQHAKNAIGLLWPEMVSEKYWNPWLERALKAFTNEDYLVTRHGVKIRVVVLTGCAAVGKTFSAGLYTTLWWLASPANSIAYFTSTSKDMVRKRIWPIIQKFSKGGVVNSSTGEVGEFGGHMVNSKPALQMVKGDDKHSIAALAVASGETTAAVAKLSGQHEERILLVIDEGQATPEAIYATIANLRKGCLDLTIIIIENPMGRLTGSGRASEPENGWKSVGLEDLEWKTKGVQEWQLEPGICVRFDGRDSPNVAAAIKAGVRGDEEDSDWRDPWPFIFTFGDWLAANHADRLNTLSYWSQDRGIQAPDGTLNTVMSEQLVERHDGRGEFIFYSEKRMIAGLDPAFGGDKCILRFAEVGDVEESNSVGSFASGRKVVQLRERLEMRIDPGSDVEIEGQIAMQVQAACTKRGVKIEDFGLDATGTGRGVAYALSQTWGSGYHKVEFGGLPSDMSFSEEDTRSCREIFDRKVTELWWMVREFTTAGQLKGLTVQDVKEFCSREYRMVGKKYSVETKKDMKVKIGYSPDDADAVAVVIDVARVRGVSPMTRKAVRRDVEALNDLVRRSGEVETVDESSGGWGEQEVW